MLRVLPPPALPGMLPVTEALMLDWNSGAPRTLQALSPHALHIPSSRGGWVGGQVGKAGIGLWEQLPPLLRLVRVPLLSSRLEDGVGGTKSTG